ncbi:uncharacterized protein [Aristolochia californica]|uniref:uncharacterized protein n=1 Tax=Aristolochia californica TaxID=171875 RepID=UPI0035DF1D87
MADFGGPSFSLGLDLEDENPLPALKRPKQGPATQLPAAVSQESVQQPNVDDEMEDFSSKLDHIRGKPGCGQTSSACSSSKFTLPGHWILINQSTSKSNAHKSFPASNASNTGSLDSSGIKGIFPNLTISPLRKIQFLDSDDPSMNNSDASDVRNVGAPSEDIVRTYSTYDQESIIESNICARSDLVQTKRIHSATPAVDQFCEEYFTSMKGKGKDQRKKIDVDAGSSNSLVSVYCMTAGCFQSKEVLDNRNYHWNLPNPAPPAYRYFNHGDPRVRKLIHNRIPNFSPVGVVNNRENQHSENHSWDLPNPAPPAYHYFNHSDPRVRKLIHNRIPNFSPVGVVNSTGNQHSENYIWDQSNPAPPAYRYCNHSDPRVRQLIHSRLPNFSPVGVVNNRENQHSEASVIDYMSQFGN